MHMQRVCIGKKIVVVVMGKFYLISISNINKIACHVQRNINLKESTQNQMSSKQIAQL